jgi:hypothetical protein
MKKSETTLVENNCNLFGDALVRDGTDFEKGSTGSATGSGQF